jgi:site-specific DNA-cytosine methylase
MIIDLCCGIGRWPTDEEVIKIDIQRKVKPDIIADLRQLPLRPGLKPRLVHASPPCKYVSKARRWGMGWNPKGVAESFRLLASCFDAFAYLEPETCTIEQPAGLENLLGYKVTFKYDKSDIRNCTTNFYSNNKSLRRAVIPQDVRQAILDVS